jgi:mannose-1-phosphate guanylyltransferase
MNKNNFCVIMAGGVGARFWPMSRNSKPKQFIDILGTGKTLIQLTFERFERIIPKENIYVVTNLAYRDLVKEQLPYMNDSQIILEPARRNTAPCIAYATYKINKLNPNANIVVAPSDHVILKEDDFLQIVDMSLQAVVDKDILMTLGIKPSRPDTGYGYIQYVEPNPEQDNYYSFKNKFIKKVKTFTEKPVYEIAQTFVESGDFLWNSGIFIWTSSSIIKSIEKFLPDIASLFAAIQPMLNTDQEADVIQNTYTECRSISIDYGVMEKANNVYVHISDFGWSDLGTWGSLHDTREKDTSNNAVHGKNVMLYETTNSIVHVPNDKLVVIHGLNDFIVVENDNILLICNKNDEQKIKNFVNDVMVEKGDDYV